MNRQFNSLVTRFTEKQIAIAGGSVVALLLIMSVITFTAVGWSYSVDLAAKRERERIAEKMAKVFTMPAKKNAKPVEWLTHDKESTIGDAKITIIGGDFGMIKWLDKGLYGTGKKETLTKEKTANIRIRIVNTSAAKIIEYSPWHTLTVFGEPAIKDEHGNKCEVWHSFSGDLASGLGVSSDCKIKPGESIEDTVAFTYPLPISSEFFIALSGRAFELPSIGDDNFIRFKIPRSFFVEAK